MVLVVLVTVWQPEFVHFGAILDFFASADTKKNCPFFWVWRPG